MTRNRLIGSDMVQGTESAGAATLAALDRVLAAAGVVMDHAAQAPLGLSERAFSDARTLQLAKRRRDLEEDDDLDDEDEEDEDELDEEDDLDEDDEDFDEDEEEFDEEFEDEDLDEDDDIFYDDEDDD